MNSLAAAVAAVVEAQSETRKPIAIVLAGHNGSGKSTMWHDKLADTFRIPLINADRMMMSVLPEVGRDGMLVTWAQGLRDNDRDWMRVAQKGVQAFVGHAMSAKVPFAMETVFSYWQPRANGTVASKIELIQDMQAAGYFVLLFFVGLQSADLSVLRVDTRVQRGGHGVPSAALHDRFPRTQQAIREAAKIADATILADNSRSPAEAFTVCRVQLRLRQVYDIRDHSGAPPRAIADWLAVVAPR